ncbi:aspartate kinase [Bacillus sp. 1P10SD]|uniref:aspartate kinase n=1 Tax=Bacillus sp. 1P10SD TaxID=3132265 RepID=UPI0039A6E518
MGMIVQKFGGTSVGTIERILKAADKIIAAKQKGKDVVVVVSAMGKTTDVLVDMAREIWDEVPEREMDMLLSTGEQVSIALLSMALQSKGYSAVSLTGWQAGILTEPEHSKARIKEIDTFKILSHIHMGKIVIVAGFQGVTENGEITTLGRGGSDTTAVALASSLNADLCEIYTDVDGVYSADPRIVPTARKIKSISFDEMLEMAKLGAGVLHPRAVKYAKKYKVRLTVRSSYSNVEGTYIQGNLGMEKDGHVCGIPHTEDVVSIIITNFLNEADRMYALFSSLMQSRIPIDFFYLSSKDLPKTNISFVVSKEDAKLTLKLLESLKESIAFDEAYVETGLGIVSIVGEGLISATDIVPKMLTALACSNVSPNMISSSENVVSCLVPADRMVTAVRSLHSSFGLDTAELVIVH